MGPPNQSVPPTTVNKGTGGPPQLDRSQQESDLLLPSVEKTSLEILLESTERTAPFSDNPQFGLLRDSLVFNHERILQHTPQHNVRHQSQQETQTQLTRMPPGHHYPSLILNTADSRTNMEPGAALLFEEDGDEYKVQPGLNRRAQNMANANLDKHVGWQQSPVGIRERIGMDLQFDTSGDIPLTNTAASLHLASVPAGGLLQDDEKEPPSATTVTTVYAYKCNRTSRHLGGKDIVQSLDNFSNPLYEERTQEVPYPYGLSTGLNQQTNTDQVAPNDGNQTSEKQSQTGFPEDGRDVESKLNTTNMTTEVNVSPPIGGDYATTDDDLDDELMSSTNGQKPPVFPNPADLKWPEFAYLMATLDPKYHPFLEPSCKKDCRSWLWKNEKGRKARGLLEKGASRTSLSNYPRVTSIDVNNTIRAFSDNDDFDDDSAIVGLGH